MNIVEMNTDISFLVLENVYSQQQINSIWKELEIFVDKDIFLDPEQSGTARYDDGTPMKKNKAVFVDQIYSQEFRHMSSIISYPEQVLLNAEVKNMMQNVHPAFGTIFAANQHSTLVSYYESTDMYDFHFDYAAYSTLSYFFKEPQKFSGGEIVFRVNEEILEIPVKNNMSIIFPSSYYHKVNPIVMEEKDMGKGLGRFCISQFLGVSLN